MIPHATGDGSAVFHVTLALAAALPAAGGTITAMTESAPPAGSTSTDPLLAGRAAIAGHAWREAFDLFSRADREHSLAGPDLESFSEAAFFVGQAPLGIELKERAFKEYQGEEDQVRAAYLALDIAHDYGMTGKISIASAWLRRGEKLLEGKPESYAHAYLALCRSEAARSRPPPAIPICRPPP